MSSSTPVRWGDVGSDVALAPTAKAEWGASQRYWARGWRAAVLVFLPLIYLIYVGGAVHKYSQGAQALAGYGILGAFGIGYVALTLLVRGGEAFSPRRFLPLYGLLTALLVAELPFARAAAFVMGLYLAMIGVAKFGARAVPVVAGLTLASIFVPAAVPS
ncbi:MAG: hypothetical protein ACLQVK_19490, partial [Acidimicrobiales bacterium]